MLCQLLNIARGALLNSPDHILSLLHVVIRRSLLDEVLDQFNFVNATGLEATAIMHDQIDTIRMPDLLVHAMYATGVV